MNFVFDFGRVLFDWQPEHLLQRLLPARAFDAASTGFWTEQIFQRYGGDWGEFDRGSVTPTEVVQRIAARTGLGRHEVQAVVDAVPDSLQPIAASLALMRRLRQPGQPMFFLSNMPASYADRLEQQHDFVREFDDGVFSGRVRLIKPDPAIFQFAAQRFGVPPAQLVFLDDHAPNVAAARALGWQALVFNDARQCTRDLRAAGLWPETAGGRAPSRG